MSTTTRPPACVPTWHGHIETTKDALLIFEACFNGILHHCSRRPHDRERNQLIVSGNVFVYEEATSGIKRWTDGIPWSPSRILTNFLIYRQLNSPFPPGEKKRATKRTSRPSRPGEPYSTPPSSGNTPTADEHKSFPAQPQDSPLARNNDESPDKDSNRGLVGSLVDSYEFKEGGLLKKTMTVTVRNVQHHLVSYYSLDDAKNGLQTPRDDPRLKDITITQELIKQPKFKFPNLDDAGDGTFENQEQQHYPGHYYANGAHYYPQPYAYPTSVPYSHPNAYAPSHPPQGGYSLPPTNAMYASAGSQYGHYHPHQYYQQHVQHVPQGYQSNYPQHAQHYQAHQAATHSPVTPVKQEAGTSATPQYNYNTSAPNPPVNDVYAQQQTNGTSAPADEENVVPATTQPAQAQTWPINNSYSQTWAARPETASYPAYRGTG